MKDQVSALTDRLNRLFESVRRWNGCPYSNEQVAESIRRASSGTVTQSYIWQLRNGKKDKPNTEALGQPVAVPIVDATGGL